MKCKCSKTCEAVVKGRGDYTIGHNPASHIDRIITKAFRKKMSQITTGRKKSKATKDKLSRSHKLIPKAVRVVSDMQRSATKRKNGSMDRIVKAMIKGQKKAWRDPVKRACRIRKLKAAWKRDYKHRINILHDEIIPKQKKTMAGRDPVGRPRGGRTVWYYGKCGHIAMSCKAEVNYAKYLDSIHELWLYEAFTFSIGARKERTWTPDFYLPRLKKFVEVKAWVWSTPEVIRKIKRAIKHYSNTKFEILLSNSKECRKLAA